MLRVLDLFSGIGGFSLGLERTGGFRTVAFCEIEPYCAEPSCGKRFSGIKQAKFCSNACRQRAKYRKTKSA